MKNYFTVVVSVLTTAILAVLFFYLNAFAFNGPSQNPPSGSGVVVANGGGLSVGTSTPASNTSLLVVGSTTNSSAYGLNVLNSAGTTLFSVRNDGTVSVGTSTISGGSFAGTVSAGNVSAGAFGSNTGGGNYSFPSNVGIGTTTPTTQLAIETSDALAEIGESGGAGNSGYMTISLNGEPVDNPSTTQDYNFASAITDQNLYISRPNGSDIELLRQGSTVDMDIQPNDNVEVDHTLSIGETSQGDSFDDVGAAGINGNIYDGGFLMEYAAGGTQILLDSNGTDWGTLQNDANNTWSLGYNTTYSSVLGTPVLSWDGSGEVGIGTTTPATALDVNGDITDENVKSAACLATNSTGKIISTTCGSGGVSTSTANTWTASQTFNAATTLATTTAGNFTETGTDATTTASFGATALTAGKCTSSTVSVPGVPTTAAVIVTPQGFPGTGIWWEGYISTTGTAVVEICAATTTTPTAEKYNVRIIR